MTVSIQVAGNSDSFYEMSETDMATNDGKYHSIRLTRRVNNVNLSVDNPMQRRLTSQCFYHTQFLFNQAVVIMQGASCTQAFI